MSALQRREIVLLQAAQEALKWFQNFGTGLNRANADIFIRRELHEALMLYAEHLPLSDADRDVLAGVK